jgi:hypothetical protein
MGTTIQESRHQQGRPLRDRRGAGGSRPGQRGSHPARHAEDAARSRCPPRALDEGAHRLRQERRRALHERRASPGRRSAGPRRVRPLSVGHDRSARAHVPGEHEEEPLRPDPHGGAARRADARAGPRDPPGRARYRGAGGAAELSGSVPRAGSGASLELTRRSHALDAHHPASDRARLQARTAGAVDAVPDVGGLLSIGSSARGHLDLPRPR